MDEPMEASTTVQTQTTSGHESGDDPIDQTHGKVGSYNLQLFCELGEQRLQTESHEHRIQALRTELEHIAATEWQHEPIEKFIGQA